MQVLGHFRLFKRGKSALQGQKFDTDDVKSVKLLFTDDRQKTKGYKARLNVKAMNLLQ